MVRTKIGTTARTTRYYLGGVYVRDVRDAGAGCGAKAAGLARLIEAGLPVPAGFVIDDRAFRAVAGELAADLDAMGHALEAARHRIAEAEVPAQLVDEVRDRMKELG